MEESWFSRFSSDAAVFFAALGEGDSWAISESLRGELVWPILLVMAGGLALAIYYFSKVFPKIDSYIEPTLMTVSYLSIATIIFVEVIRRFAFGVQEPWSTTLPPFLFLIMTWFGCAYNVRKRSHLSFSEWRTRFSRPTQMACLTLDAVLWIFFSAVVIVGSVQITVNSAANFQILLGTDDVMQWWFLISVPISFTVIASRAFGNWVEDIKNYKHGRPLITTVAIGGE